MNTTLLLYSTTDGHTRKIAETLSMRLSEMGHTVKVSPVHEAAELELQTYDSVVLGAAIRYGKHHKEVYAFVEHHLDFLNSRPNAFFSVNLVARKPEKTDAHSNPYVRKFLAAIPWDPQLVGVFAGLIDYPRYGFWDRIMIQLIMKMTKGPTDPTATIEYTDWERVDAFAEQCHVAFAPQTH